MYNKFLIIIFLQSQETFNQKPLNFLKFFFTYTSKLHILNSLNIFQIYPFSFFLILRQVFCLLLVRILKSISFGLTAWLSPKYYEIIKNYVFLTANPEKAISLPTLPPYSRLPSSAHPRLSLVLHHAYCTSRYTASIAITSSTAINFHLFCSSSVSETPESTNQITTHLFRKPRSFIINSHIGLCSYLYPSDSRSIFDIYLPC